MPAPAVFFGSGTLVAKPVAGDEAPNPTPMTIGVLQDSTVEISREIKELYGQFQAPVAIAAAKHKFTGKAKHAQIFGKQWADLVFGQTTSAGYKAGKLLGTFTVPSTSPYTVTITPPGAGTFSEDLGVSYAATGIPFIKETPLAAGEYTVDEATGVYTFGAADAGASVIINYLYSVATGGVSMTWQNQLMGFGPIFEVDLVVPYAGQQAVLRLFNCVASKISLATKFDDFTMDDFEYSAFANAAGQVFELDFTQG